MIGLFCCIDCIIKFSIRSIVILESILNKLTKKTIISDILWNGLIYDFVFNIWFSFCCFYIFLSSFEFENCVVESKIGDFFSFCKWHLDGIRNHTKTWMMRLHWIRPVIWIHLAMLFLVIYFELFCLFFFACCQRDNFHLPPYKLKFVEWFYKI